MIPSRRTMFRWHSWLGLATGAFMLAIAWSGSIAVFNDEIGWLATPELRADPSRGQRSLDEVVASLAQAYPGRRFDLHVQNGERWAHTAYVYERGATRFVHIDPATAQITRDDVMSGYTWNVVYFIRQLHVRLLMGFWGRVFVGIFGVTLVLSIVTSLWVYREWWRSLFRVRRDRGRRIFHMDLHKLVGAWALVINLLFGVTGAVLGLENLYNRVVPRGPRPAVPAPAPALPSLAPGLTPGSIVAALASADPAFVPTVVAVNPSQPAVVVRGDHPGALIAKDASSYRVHAPSGRILERRDARAAPWSSYLYNTLDPLHFGYFGDKWHVATSYAIKVLWCVLGLTPGVLVITGSWMWLLRRRRASAAATARAVMTGGEAAAPAWKLHTTALLPFLLVGYALQAVLWDRGWMMSELLWQHWIVKPLCLILVAFPLTFGALALGRSASRLGDGVPAAGRALLAVAPLGVLYLSALALFN